MDVNANEAFAILMREVRSPVDCLTEASVDHFESIVLKHLDKLQARVRELEEALLEISRNQIPYGTYTPDAGEDIQIVHMRMSAWQLLHGIGYELNTKGTP